MSTPRVVLVDSNPDFLDRTQELLIPHFNVVGSFQNGRALLDTWRKLKPGIVVLEISMAPLGGLDVARELRDLGCDAPLVFLTSHSDTEFVRAAFAAGASAYVLKPYMASELVPALNTVLSGKRFLSAALLEIRWKHK
jgi:DNA-binding NarL/FixJ family response regulator